MSARSFPTRPVEVEDEPVEVEDEDVDPPRRTLRGTLVEHPALVLVTISAGGVTGALARHGLGELLPHRSGGWPWATLLANASGCLLIGLLMAVITDVGSRWRLLRPFLGVGVLGGYTTFSIPMVQAQQMVEAGAPRAALAYLGFTLAVALIAVSAGWTVAHSVPNWARRIRRRIRRVHRRTRGFRRRTRGFRRKGRRT